MGKLIAFMVVAIVAVVGVSYWYTSYARLDPGDIGILVDYGDGKVVPVTESGWHWVGRYQHLVKWPIGQQVYLMDRSGDTGQIKGDDSVSCLTNDTQNIAVDVQTDWRIDPLQIVQTYQLWRDIPLTGPINRASPGSYLEDAIIRNETRNAVRTICSEFGWSDVLGTRQLDFQTQVDAAVRKSSAGKGVIIDQVTIRQRYPSDALAALMAARLEGQRQQEASAFAAAQATRQQQIDQAAAVAAGEKNRIDTESRNKLLVANAQANAQVAKTQADQQADAIRSQGQAEADALKAQASAITPTLVDLERAKKWNGAGPVTVIGGDPQLVNQIPVQH